MTNHFNLTVAYKDHRNEDRIDSVGVMFQQKPDAKSAYKLVLDFPVGMTELLAFVPREADIPSRDHPDFYVLQIPVKMPDGRTRWRPIGVMFAERTTSKVAFRIKLRFPVGATEFVAFEPKDAEPENDQP